MNAISHRGGPEVSLGGDELWELVNEVHRGAGDDGPAAGVLQAEHSVGLLISMRCCTSTMKDSVT